MRFARGIGGWISQRSLVLRFALISAVLVALLGTVLTTWQGDVIRRANIASASRTATYSMGVATGVLGSKPGNGAAIDAAQYAQVTLLLRSMVATHEYLGATAWGPNVSGSGNQIVYAVEKGRSGQHEPARPQVAEALAGKLVTTEVSSPSDAIPDPTERRALHSGGTLLEVYTPVRLNGTVFAAVEFYQPWKPVQQLIASQTREMLLIVGAGLLLLWAGLLSLVLSASRKLRAQSAENRQFASHDSLTGLPNRKLLGELGQLALQAGARSGRPVGVLLLDLDNFKEVNDTLGHHSGDLLLQQVAGRLSGTLRGGDSVARLGGDEFVVLLTALEAPVEAEAAAQRIINALSEPFVVDDVSLDIEASIGVAVSPQHGTDMESLLQHADIGMYTAKASRSGVAVYSPEADRRSPRQLGMLGQLRRAVNDASQLVLHYQPKVALATGELLGVEALVRWQHPTEGLLLPGEFIPLAEQTGLIHPLTVLILEQALVQSRIWSQAGHELPVAVNISARNLLDSGFPALVARLLREHHAHPANLELEITESAIMIDPEKAIAVLIRLRALGVVLTIDDFGTGYSSMTRLAKLPVQQLKVDQSFVTHMTKGSKDAAIVRSCIELGHNLGMTVVAEGVETAAVWNELMMLGCDQAQGYFLGTPMPAEGIEAWMAGKRVIALPKSVRPR